MIILKTSIIFLLIFCFVIIVISGIVELAPINTETYPNTREDGLLYSSIRTGGYDGDIYEKYLIFKDGTVIIFENKTKTVGTCDISHVEKLQKEIEKLNFKPEFVEYGMTFDGIYGNKTVYNGRYLGGVIISYTDDECKELSKESQKLNKKYKNILDNIESLSSVVIQNIKK